MLFSGLAEVVDENNEQVVTRLPDGSYFGGRNLSCQFILQI